MKLLKNALLLFIAVLMISNISYSQDTELQEYKSPDSIYTKNCIYMEGEILLVVNHLSFNYERLISENFSMRTGFGGGLIFAGVDSRDALPEGNSGYGLMFMINYLTKGEHKFEAGMGFSYTNRGENVYKLSECFPSFAISLAYRYQPTEHGFFFRAGLTRVYYYGLPFQLSVGYAF